VDSKHGIEQVGELDSVGFGDQPEGGALAVEAPRPALLDDLDARLVIAVAVPAGRQRTAPPTRGRARR
jgi:hypothetical protein